MSWDVPLLDALHDLWRKARLSGCLERRDRAILRYANAIRLIVVTEIRNAGGLEAYEAQVRRDMSRGKGTGR